MAGLPHDAKVYREITVCQGIAHFTGKTPWNAGGSYGQSLAQHLVPKAGRQAIGREYVHIHAQQ
jgi:hypothetical protein